MTAAVRIFGSQSRRFCDVVEELIWYWNGEKLFDRGFLSVRTARTDLSMVKVGVWA